MAFTKMLITSAILIVLLKQAMAQPSFIDGQITGSWPPPHTQINEIATYFGPNCSLHIVRVEDEENLGPIQVPLILSFPRQTEDDPKYQWHQSAGTHSISRDILHVQCLVKVILPYSLHPPFSPANGDWPAYLMETGAQRHLKYPKYYVILKDAKSLSEPWYLVDYNLERITNIVEAAPLFFLFYDLDSNAKTAAEDMVPVSTRVVCHYCPEVAQAAHCEGARDCLGICMTMLEKSVDGGKNVKWLVSKHYFYTNLKNNVAQGFNTAPCHWPFSARTSERGACVEESTEGSVLSFSLGSLNSTLQARNVKKYRRTKYLLPRIQWSFVDYHYDHEVVRGIVSPLHIIPFVTVNQSRTSLKLITADGVKPKTPAIDLYLSPFDLPSWFCTLVLIFGATSFVMAIAIAFTKMLITLVIYYLSVWSKPSHSLS